MSNVSVPVYGDVEALDSMVSKSVDEMPMIRLADLPPVQVGVLAPDVNVEDATPVLIWMSPIPRFTCRGEIPVRERQFHKRSPTAAIRIYRENG